MEAFIILLSLLLCSILFQMSVLFWIPIFVILMLALSFNSFIVALDLTINSFDYFRHFLIIFGALHRSWSIIMIELEGRFLQLFTMLNFVFYSISS